MAGAKFDVLTLTATEAVKLLQDGTTTSEKLVEAYLDQIEKHNHAGLCLNALISVAPRDLLLETAKRLDRERRSGQLRGPLHGIPFITKDVFVTEHSLGLPTTVGAPCFASAKAKRTAPVIQHLLDSGMILLGKANLTEFCGLRMKGLTPGYSAAGGQTQSPYIFGGLEPGEKVIGHSSAGGSSSGSASGVAAGFAPLSIGTECCGSLITPANRAAMYALKCGLDEVDADGVFRYSDCIDFIGGMAKSVADLSALTAALMQRKTPFDIGGGFQGLRVGFTDVKGFRLSDDICSWPSDTRDQMESGYRVAVEKLGQLGATVTENVLPANWDLFKIDGKSCFYEIMSYQFPTQHLPAFFEEFMECEVHSLQELVDYNEKHKDLCMPPPFSEQGELIELLDSTRTEEDCQATIAEMQRRGRSALDELLASHDLIVALSDSPLVMYSSAAGLPIACVPLGTVTYSKSNERPYGLCMLAGKGHEGLLLRTMAAFEAAFAPRPVPRPMKALSEPLET